MGIGSKRWGVGGVAALAACLTLTVGAAAVTPKRAPRQGPGRPELRIGHTEIELVAGKLVGSVALRNSGGSAGKSTLAISSRLRARTVRRRLRTIHAPAISAGKRAVLRVNAAFGSGRAPGVYVVEACADVDHRVAESNEADNCKHVALVRVSGTPGIAPVEVEDADDPDEPDPVDGPDVPEDTTPPDTTMDSAPSGSVNDGPQSVSFHASEAGSTLECRLDAGLWASCTSPRAIEPLAGGSHSFEVRASDATGNVDPTPAVATWTTIDTTPPRTVIDSGPANSIDDRNATFVFHSTEPGGTFQCRLDEGPAGTPLDWAACPSPYSFTVLHGGPHRFDVRAIDAAGNVDPAGATYYWNIENA